MSKGPTPRQAQEWHSAADLFVLAEPLGEAEKLYLKLLEEREHSLGLNSPELLVDLNDLGHVP